MKDIVDDLFQKHPDTNQSDTENEPPNANETASARKKKQNAKKKKRPEKDRVRDLDWSKVAELVGNGRKSAECLRRYNKISGHRGGEKAAALKGPWTEEEDNKVISLVRAHGARKWSQIAAELPGEY